MDCPSKSQGNGNSNGSYRYNGRGRKFKGKCFICGKYGHKKEACFELEKNADKRPKGWKSSRKDSENESETAMKSTDEVVEHAMVAKAGIDHAKTCEVWKKHSVIRKESVALRKSLR